ncbi:MAG TPA: RsmE family RNA methyltransferase [Nitrospiria bacterium]|nr:RsmE family RNA methyltransferase [Nitrospiria bacterium]
MPVYFVDESAVRPPVITIRGQLARHLAGALRMQPGEQCWFVDPLERRYHSELTAVSPDRITATILREEPPAPPLRPVTLAQAILKGHRMDWLLQKASELGATRIVPLVTERTIVRPRRERWPAQLDRWRTILLEAAQQSGRNRPPELSQASDLRTALADVSPDSARFILSEHDHHALFGRAVTTLPEDQPLFVVVGPEGGLSRDEVSFAETMGARAVSLGRLTLRAETAALAALALIHGLSGPPS